MKAILVVLFLLLIAVALYLGLSVKRPTPQTVGPATNTPPASAAPAVVPAATPPAPATPATPTATPAEGVVTGTIHDLHQAADYATGYTPLKIKQRSEKKINDINAAHNAEVEKAIEEN